jgi:hypothetical protein
MLCGAATVGWLAWTARDDLATVFRSVLPDVFIAAVIAGVLFTAVQSVLFFRLAVKHDCQSEARELMAAFLVSQLAKYVPGKIWSVVTQSLVLGRPDGFTGIAIANVELVAIGAIHMTTLGMVGLWLHNRFVVATILVGGLILGGAVMVFPTTSLFRRLPAVVLKALRLNPTLSAERTMSVRHALALSGGLLGLNLVASVCVLLAAGSSVPVGEHIAILSVLYLSFATSLMAVPVPAGLGVREAATVGLGLLLAPQVASSLLVSIALLVRCWQLATDTACLGVGAAMLAIRQPPTHRTGP